MSRLTAVSVTLNGEGVSFLCEPGESLLEVLRNRLNLTGTKEGCNNGNCGACSVILDGELVDSCLVLAVETDGRDVTTIEGIAALGSAPGDGESTAGGASEGKLHPLQRAFLREAALQCGVCTPGFIVAAKALLDREPHPDEARVRHWLAGNLCRCTGYDKIVRAVLAASADEGPGMGTHATGM
ncbi:MAG: (2Fe-2S)-binding protein [Chloroflexota bacterium]